MNIQVAGFLDNSLVNGEGLRAVLFVSGCSNNCPGCHNKEMQNYNYGEKLDVKEIFKRIEDNSIIRGVTFSGGEPFDQARGLCELAGLIKNKGLSLWSYSGYTFEEILNSGDKSKIELLKFIDVLVDGPFKEELTDGAPKYAGSKNQRIIDVKESLKRGEVILNRHD